MIDYNGYRIVEVWKFTDGKSQFEYYPIGNPEKTSIFQGTVEECKREIDLYLIEN